MDEATRLLLALIGSNLIWLGIYFHMRARERQLLRHWRKTVTRLSDTADCLNTVTDLLYKLKAYVQSLRERQS